MRFRLRTDKLRRLYTETQGAHKYAAGVVDAFFEVVAIIVAAPDERELYRYRSLKFEELKGNRKGQYSLRLNKQYRLIVTIEHDEDGAYLLIEAINRHYE